MAGFVISFEAGQRLFWKSTPAQKGVKDNRGTITEIGEERQVSAAT